MMYPDDGLILVFRLDEVTGIFQRTGIYDLIFAAVQLVIIQAFCFLQVIKGLFIFFMTKEKTCQLQRNPGMIDIGIIQAGLGNFYGFIILFLRCISLSKIKAVGCCI